MGEVSQAGALVSHEGLGQWLAAVPKEEWPEDIKTEHDNEQGWDKNYGDRKQEIVFIGLIAEMNKDEICKRLDRCLIKDYLENPTHYQKLKDPFPIWFEGYPLSEEIENN